MIEIGVPEKNKVTGTWIYYADGGRWRIVRS
jgi:hypothetical protein